MPKTVVCLRLIGLRFLDYVGIAMTDKRPLIEIQPRRLDSDGDWCVSNDQEAEFWAMIYVEKDGREEVWGEYPTRSAAKRAVRSLGLTYLLEEKNPTFKKWLDRIWILTFSLLTIGIIGSCSIDMYEYWAATPLVEKKEALELSLFDHIARLDPDATAYEEYLAQVEEVDAEISELQRRWDKVPTGVISPAQNMLRARLQDAKEERDTLKIPRLKREFVKSRGPMLERWRSEDSDPDFVAALEIWAKRTEVVEQLMETYGSEQPGSMTGGEFLRALLGLLLFFYLCTGFYGPFTSRRYFSEPVSV